MNPLLLERSSGRLGANQFARIQAATLLRSFAAAPRFRFDGSEHATTRSAGLETQGTGSAVSTFQNDARADDASRPAIRAHPAGVSALALERFDGRL
jgi:DNA excision repair protein ERCC-8